MAGLALTLLTLPPLLKSAYDFHDALPLFKPLCALGPVLTMATSRAVWVGMAPVSEGDGEGEGDGSGSKTGSERTGAGSGSSGTTGNMPSTKPTSQQTSKKQDQETRYPRTLLAAALLTLLGDVLIIPSMPSNAAHPAFLEALVFYFLSYVVGIAALSFRPPCVTATKPNSNSGTGNRLLIRGLIVAGVAFSAFSLRSYIPPIASAAALSAEKARFVASTGTTKVTDFRLGPGSVAGVAGAAGTAMGTFARYSAWVSLKLAEVAAWAWEHAEVWMVVYVAVLAVFVSEAVVGAVGLGEVPAQGTQGKNADSKSGSAPTTSTASRKLVAIGALGVLAGNAALAHEYLVERRFGLVAAGIGAYYMGWSFIALSLWV